MADHIVEVKGFNPFMYIFIFEEFISNPALYDKDKLIEFMKNIEDNKENPDKIKEFLQNLNESQHGGANEPENGATEPPQSEITKSLEIEIKDFIENAEGIIKKTTQKESSNLLYVNLVFKIAAMAIIARDAHANPEVSKNNLTEITKTPQYLLDQLTEYKNALPNTEDPELKKIMGTHIKNIDNLIDIVNAANQKVNDASKSDVRNPEEKPSIDFVRESNDETIKILKEMLTTSDINLNIIAAKAILASACAFATISCLSRVKGTTTNVELNKTHENFKKESETILQKSIDIIYDAISTGSNADSEINEKINKTISILKKMCTPQNMIELFMEVLYFNEKSNSPNSQNLVE